MAIAPVGTHDANFTASGTTLALPARSATAGGNLLVVAAVVGNVAAIPTISDTQNNTWRIASPVTVVGGATEVIISWYALAINPSSTTITIASNVAATFIGATLDEFTGVDQIKPLDQVTSVTTSGNPTSGSFTPTYDDELIWAYGADTITAVGNIGGAAATVGANDGQGDWSEFRVLVGGRNTSMTAAFTGSLNGGIQVATFRPPQVPIWYTQGTSIVRQARG